MLTAEQIMAMNAEQVLSYSKELAEQTRAIAEASKLIAARVAAAKEAQGIAAREALQAELRDTLKFPKLTAETVAAIKGSGGERLVIVYDLETGIGTPSVIYPAAGKRAVKKDGTAVVHTLRVQDRDLKSAEGDYSSCTPEAERAEDAQRLESRVAAARIAGSFPKGKKGPDGVFVADVPYVFNEAKCRGSNGWSIWDARIKSKAKQIAG